MAKTKSQFCNQVLRNLSALAAGQSVEAEDAARVDDGATSALEFLARAGVYDGVYEYQNDDISEAAFMALARYVANEIGSVYGVPYSPDVRLMAERDLCRVVAMVPTYATQAVDYF
jgi:hypothetical protein